MHIQVGEIRGFKGPKGRFEKGNGSLTLALPHGSTHQPTHVPRLGHRSGKMYTGEGSYNEETNSRRKTFMKARV